MHIAIHNANHYGLLWPLRQHSGLIVLLNSPSKFIPMQMN